jgi:hypothetical protein
MRPTSFNSAGFALLALAAVGAAVEGCAGPANKLGTVAAGGVVTYRGEPLGGATVTLAPQQGQRPAVGLSDATGRFQLTEVPKNVAAMSVEEMRAYEALMMKGPMKLKEPEELLPAQYRDQETTPLSCEVKATGDNEFVFELTD